MTITAKENVNAWTTPEGGLRQLDEYPFVIFRSGEKEIYLDGDFDADILQEIVMHMRSTQK